MSFFALSFPMGTFAGIAVRIHITFLLYAFMRLSGAPGRYGEELLFLLVLYASILLHEFGHALAARWCDGEARLIVLWPLGGLAFVRPRFHPTAHLITSAAGPAVTLALVVISWLLGQLRPWFLTDAVQTYALLRDVMWLNGLLLVFNLIPAFPMDGGRILRDILWYKLGVKRATRTAVFLSRLTSGCAVAWALSRGDYHLAILAGFIFTMSGGEQAGAEQEEIQPFSIRERLNRK